MSFGIYYHFVMLKGSFQFVKLYKRNTTFKYTNFCCLFMKNEPHYVAMADLELTL